MSGLSRDQLFSLYLLAGKIPKGKTHPVKGSLVPYHSLLDTGAVHFFFFKKRKGIGRDGCVKVLKSVRLVMFFFFRAADSGAGYKSKKLPIFHERYVNGKRYLNGKVLISLVNSPRSRHGEANTCYGTDRKIRQKSSRNTFLGIILTR